MNIVQTTKDVILLPVMAAILKVQDNPPKATNLENILEKNWVAPTELANTQYLQKQANLQRT